MVEIASVEQLVTCKIAEGDSAGSNALLHLPGFRQTAHVVAPHQVRGVVAVEVADAEQAVASQIAEIEVGDHVTAAHEPDKCGIPARKAVDPNSCLIGDRRIRNKAKTL